MTTNEHNELRELIELRIEFLQALINENIQSAGQIQPERGWPLSPKEERQSVEEKVIETAQLEILELTQSLVWLETDQAGRCEQCGSPIDMNKLKSAPANRCCESCIEQKCIELACTEQTGEQ